MRRGDADAGAAELADADLDETRVRVEALLKISAIERPGRSLCGRPLASSIFSSSPRSEHAFSSLGFQSATRRKCRPLVPWWSDASLEGVSLAIPNDDPLETMLQRRGRLLLELGERLFQLASQRRERQLRAVDLLQELVGVQALPLRPELAQRSPA